jgi:hypothetical protein
MMSSKLPLPEPAGMAAAYRLLLKKEAIVKPASITYRKQILENIKRTNHKNEYDRLQGLLEGQADRFSLPGGHYQRDKLINRQQMLKKLFKETYQDDKHPIMGK